MDQCDLDDLMASMRQEFLESCRDKLANANAIAARILRGTEEGDDVRSLRRDIHSIKGQGTTFGFPTISTIAHKLEDYLESAGGIFQKDIQHVQRFLDAMDDVVDTGQNPEAAATEDLLRRLPVYPLFTAKNAATVSEQKAFTVSALLVMPKGMWRMLLAKELGGCGFRLGYADTGLGAINAAVPMPPDLVVSVMELPDMTGAELAGAFGAIKRLRKGHFALLTSYGPGETAAELPDGLAIIAKNAGFQERIAELLLEWKLV